MSGTGSATRTLPPRSPAYWELLSGDPGPDGSEDKATAAGKNKELRDAVEALHDTPASFDEVAKGITPVFSPRGGPTVLDMYAHMVDEAEGPVLHHARVRHQRGLQGLS